MCYRTRKNNALKKKLSSKYLRFKHYEAFVKKSLCEGVQRNLFSNVNIIVFSLLEKIHICVFYFFTDLETKSADQTTSKSTKKAQLDTDMKNFHFEACTSLGIVSIYIFLFR